MSGNNRADRASEIIENRIKEGHKFTVQSVKDLQYDKVDYSAKEIVLNLLKLADENKESYIKLLEDHSEKEHRDHI